MTNKIPGRIYFPGNPWPQGHAIEWFDWSGCLDPEHGIRFFFGLWAEPWMNEVPSILEGTPDLTIWQQVGSWANYGQCKIDSEEEFPGFLVGTRDEPLDMRSLEGQAFHVDPFPICSHQTTAGFWSYILNHGDLADQRIRFTHRQAADCFTIEWGACVEYAGIEIATDYDPAYRFELCIEDVCFNGITCVSGLSETENQELLAQYVTDPENYFLSQDEVGRPVWLYGLG